MSTKSSHPKPAALAVNGGEPLSPEQIVEQLRVLRASIPDFGPLDAQEIQSLRRAASIRDELIQASANAVGASPFLGDAVGKDADGLRADRLDVGRWSAVQDELWAMYKGVVAANVVRRHRLGVTVLQTYFITRQLVRQREHAHLLPHVAEMRRAAKFGRRRAAKPEPPAFPAPASATADAVVKQS